ncbi:hypothetical protein [Metabacillus litoralis]|uniref:hypothetical protein n=1 Tax=Metabacillus litoralis TaxID=152268 RepID=UPI001CFDC3AB|nr:hypothetical protein [Metabacillus litoralis]
MFAKVFFICGVCLFPFGIYLASTSMIGVILSVLSGMFIFFSAPLLSSRAH